MESTANTRRRRHGETGYTVTEIVVTIAIVATLVGIAIPHLDPRTTNASAAQRLVIANLRLARTNAISKSIHFQVSFPSVSQVQISRMQENPPGSGTWQVDTSSLPQTLRLPAATQLASDLVGTTVEFNSRGIAVNLTTPQVITAQDTFGLTKSVLVWPSGQVSEP